MSRTLNPYDVFGFRSVSDPRIAADGGRLVATITRRDTATDARVATLIQTLDRASWTDLPGTEGVTVARLSPDGGQIGLIRRTGGRAAIVVHEDGGSRTLHEADTPLRELAWSADGKLLAFQQRIDAALPSWLGLPTPPADAQWAEPPRHTDRLLYRHDAMGELPESVFHIFVVPADGSSPARQLTQGAWHNGFPHHIPPGLVFSADGAALLIAGTQRPDWDTAPGETDIYAIGVADGAARRLTDIAGQTAYPSPSPDGTMIAFTAIVARGMSHHLRRLYVMNVNGGARREVLPGFDRSIGQIEWRADSAGLIVGYEDSGASHIAHVALDGTLEILARDAGAGQIEMPYAGNGFSAARDGTIAYVRTAVELPCDVALLVPGKPATTVTSLNQELASEVGGFLPAESFWVTGGEGRPVQCWLIVPRGAGPHPLVLEIHGGPYADYGARFSIKHQAIAAAGYAVLFANPAGSTGYGAAFADALHDRFPGPDFDDLMAAVDAAAARPEIDADRLFITGVSGGGVLTLWAITHTHRFRGAVAIKPVVNWESWVLGSDIGASIGLRWMGDALPWEAPEKYRDRSPLTHAPHARTPTLLMAGEADSRTPMAETLQMYAALRLAGVDTHMLRFPGTSHSSGTMRPSLFAAEIAATIGWFDRLRS